MIIQGEVEQELLRVWTLISDLSEQLEENRSVTASLREQAATLKTKASHSGTGFPLRRFNMEMSREAYEEELEKINMRFLSENQALLNDNKQLSVLVREYEQTLESVMSKFRKHAHASQEHELALTRQYEQHLLSRETETLTQELSQTASISLALSQISDLLRKALRASAGEDPSPAKGEDDLLLGAETPEAWALERECELARLERENEELRALLHLRDTKDTDTLKAEIIRETRDAYVRRNENHLENSFLSHGLDGERAPRLFSPGTYRGMNRGGKRGGIGARGKSRMFAGAHSPNW